MNGMKKYWPCLLMLPLIALAAAGWCLLPEEVVIQIGMDGQASNVVARPLAVLLPVGLGAVGAGLACGQERRTTGFVVLAVAALVSVITLVWNL